MTQPEALRLADMLENNYPLEPEAEEAAAGLRRLHEENEHLRQALLQPEWVGLTDEVIWDIKMKGRDLECVSRSALMRFAREVSNQLKEKNS